MPPPPTRDGQHLGLRTELGSGQTCWQLVEPTSGRYGRLISGSPGRHTPDLRNVGAGRKLESHLVPHSPPRGADKRREWERGLPEVTTDSQAASRTQASCFLAGCVGFSSPSCSLSPKQSPHLSSDPQGPFIWMKHCLDVPRLASSGWVTWLTPSSVKWEGRG